MISECRHIVKPQTVNVFFTLTDTHCVMPSSEIALRWLLSLWLLILSFSEVTGNTHHHTHLSLSHFNSTFSLLSMFPYHILEVRLLWTTREINKLKRIAEVRIKCFRLSVSCGLPVRPIGGQLHLVRVCVCLCSLQNNYCITCNEKSRQPGLLGGFRSQILKE